MNTKLCCWSCNQPGGEMLHFGNIHIHNTPSCREISGLPEEKHDGWLDENKGCHVNHIEVAGKRGIRIEDDLNWTDDSIRLNLTQALSLRDWLIQESPELERLAKEQEQ